MEIRSVEVIDERASMLLRRHARAEKRKRAEYLLRSDPVDLLRVDISVIQHLANRQPLGNIPKVPSPLPPVPSHLIGKYENPSEIALLLFAQEQGRPVLVDFAGKPSGARERRLRQAAKQRALIMRFFRLIGSLAIVVVAPARDPAEFDAIFLRNLGIQPDGG